VVMSTRVHEHPVIDCAAKAAGCARKLLTSGRYPGSTETNARLALDYAELTVAYLVAPETASLAEHGPVVEWTVEKMFDVVRQIERDPRPDVQQVAFALHDLARKLMHHTQTEAI
jgi:hypothetical protein